MPSHSESRLTGSLFIALVLASVCAGASAEGVAMLHVDHVYVLTSDEAARRDLFNLLTETLQLPVAGPNQAWSEGPDKPELGIIGTVSLGSVQFELTSIQQPSVMYFNTGHAGSDAFSISGLVLRPEIPYSDAVKLIDSIGLVSVPHALLDVVAIDELSNESLSVYIMEPSISWGPYNTDFESELDSRAGGPLGLIGVKELVVGVPADKLDNPFWRAFADCDENDRCRMAAGPAIALEPSHDYGIQALVLQVKSMANAETFLRSRDLLGTVTGDSINLGSSILKGLKIVLVE